MPLHASETCAEESETFFDAGETFPAGCAAESGTGETKSGSFGTWSSNRGTSSPESSPSFRPTFVVLTPPVLAYPDLRLLAHSTVSPPCPVFLVPPFPSSLPSSPKPCFPPLSFLSCFLFFYHHPPHTYPSPTPTLTPPKQRTCSDGVRVGVGRLA